MGDVLAGAAGVLLTSGLTALGGLVDRKIGLPRLLSHVGAAKPLIAGAIGVGLSAGYHAVSGERINPDSLATLAPFGTLGALTARAAWLRLRAARVTGGSGGADSQPDRGTAAGQE